jgi:hypothetical protein
MEMTDFLGLLVFLEHFFLNPAPYSACHNQNNTTLVFFSVLESRILAANSALDC